MRKVLAVLLAVIWILSIGAERRPEIDFETAGFQKMHTTAYVIHGTTATGTETRPGICACNPHLGEIAIIYTTDGQYLGMYECLDTGGTEGLQQGTVIDVWRANMTQATNYMKLTGGTVYVKWIEGEG